MTKKVTALLICVAVIVCGTFALLYKGKDGVNAFQRQYINQYLSSVPFDTDENGEYIYIPIAVASGVDGYGADEFLGARNQIDYFTGYIEVKTVVTSSNEVVLAESFSAANEKSPATLGRVIRQMEEDSGKGLVVDLSEYSRLSVVNYLLSNSSLRMNSLITGVNENALKYVKASFPNVVVLCDFGKDNIYDFQELKQVGAGGIMIPADELEQSAVKCAKEQGLLVWARCEDEYSTVKAIKFGVDGIVTMVPEFASYIMNDWCEEAFDMYFNSR